MIEMFKKEKNGWATTTTNDWDKAEEFAATHKGECAIIKVTLSSSVIFFCLSKEAQELCQKKYPQGNINLIERSNP